MLHVQMKMKSICDQRKASLDFYRQEYQEKHGYNCISNTDVSEVGFDEIDWLFVIKAPRTIVFSIYIQKVGKKSEEEKKTVVWIALSIKWATFRQQFYLECSWNDILTLAHQSHNVITSSSIHTSTLPQLSPFALLFFNSHSHQKEVKSCNFSYTIKHTMLLPHHPQFPVMQLLTEKNNNNNKRLDAISPRSQGERFTANYENTHFGLDMSFFQM